MTTVVEQTTHESTAAEIGSKSEDTPSVPDGVVISSRGGVIQPEARSRRHECQVEDETS